MSAVNGVGPSDQSWYVRPKPTDIYANPGVDKALQALEAEAKSKNNYCRTLRVESFLRVLNTLPEDVRFPRRFLITIGRVRQAIRLFHEGLPLEAKVELRGKLPTERPFLRNMPTKFLDFSPLHCQEIAERLEDGHQFKTNFFEGLDNVFLGRLVAACSAKAATILCSKYVSLFGKTTQDLFTLFTNQELNQNIMCRNFMAVAENASDRFKSSSVPHQQEFLITTIWLLAHYHKLISEQLTKEKMRAVIPYKISYRPLNHKDLAEFLSDRQLSYVHSLVQLWDSPSHPECICRTGPSLSCLPPIEVSSME